MERLVDKNGESMGRGLYLFWKRSVYVDPNPNGGFAEFPDGSTSTLYTLLAQNLTPLREPLNFVNSSRGDKGDIEFVERKLAEMNAQPLGEKAER